MNSNELNNASFNFLYPSFVCFFAHRSIQHMISFLLRDAWECSIVLIEISRDFHLVYVGSTPVIST